MIYIITHHIRKGSYVAWYNLINFKSNSDVTYWESSDKNDIETANLNSKEPPYQDALEQHIKEINPKPKDVVMFDIKYLELNVPGLTNSYLTNLGEQYGIKMVAVDDDNIKNYADSNNYTFFSNRFEVHKNNSIRNNFNYYRYRATKESYFDSIPEIIRPFMHNIREKKMNMIIGVDKKERFEVFKYTHNIGLDKSSYLAYSAFCSTYDDSILSDPLKKWKKENIPTILDTPIELSMEGNVNPQIPPFPYCLNSYVSCILETSIHGSTERHIGSDGIETVNQPEIHLSEKAWNPFLSHNIPLILGNSGINAYLIDLGFWMATDLFELSTKYTPEGIVQQYKSNLDIINKISKDELREYYMLNYRNIERNYDIMKSQKFFYNKLNYKQPKQISLI